MRGLGGRLAVVTGASSGIGRAIAIALAQAETSLLLAGRDLARLTSTAEAARCAPGDILAGDLTADETIQSLAVAAEKRGGASIMVHSAGIYERAPLAEADILALDRQYRANLRHPYLLT